MANKGYPVLALDLLGTGASTVPNGDVLNIGQSVLSLFQVLSGLKTQTSLLHRPFKRVVLVGHSVGTITSVLTLGTFPGLADLLVATGWSFAPHKVPLDPALIEAALLGQNPYVRFPDNVRTELFTSPRLPNKR